jgi:hypothetical protein
MTPDDAASPIDRWLRPFRLVRPLHDHAVHVLSALPEPVRTDLSAEPAVMFCDYDPTPGAVLQVRVGPPGRGRVGRSVVLKRTLAGRPVDFVRWLIAHELAHAYLRNGGRWPGDDPETAADALAGEWGFPRPPRAAW